MSLLKSIKNKLNDKSGRYRRAAARSLTTARSANKSGQRHQAVDAYCDAILAQQSAGQALEAAGVAKEALGHYPGERRVLRLISRLYAARGAYAEDQSGTLLLLAAAAGENEPIPAAPSGGKSPGRIEVSSDRLAVLSLFPEAAFERLVAGSRVHQLPTGGTLFAPGGMGGSIFLIMSGSVQVLETVEEGQEVETARVSAGGVLGVFSYMTGRPRAAMARSLSPLSVLEIPSEVLDYECANDAKFAAVLARFCRDRLLLNLLSSLPGYRDLPHGQKARLLGRFRLRNLEPGEEIIGQDATEPFLGLVVAGSVRVVKKSDSFEAELVVLEAGDCIGNVGSPPASPAKAAVCAGELGCKLAVLPVRATAQLRASNAEISDPRPALKARNQMLSGGIFWANSATPAALVPAAWD
ncbi:MAG: cyclic nucleotide-binding domain-containing protein [Myxococcota bacterium]|nr:cyclic nucleotide-binding domain-containing protein [Myxococcota bacterium]